MKTRWFVLILVLMVLSACGSKETNTPVVATSTATETLPSIPTPTVVDVNEAPEDIVGVWEYLEGRADFFDTFGWHSEVMEITPHYIVADQSVAMPYVWEGNRIVVEVPTTFVGKANVMLSVAREGEKLRIAKALNPKDFIVLVPKGRKAEVLTTATPQLQPGGGMPTPTPYVACKGQANTNLYVGGYAYVADNVPNRVRDGAGKSFKVVGYAQPQEAMEILDGPKCADGWTWYKVRIFSSGLVGWTAEGDGKSQYWLRPCPPGTECGQPLPENP